MKGEKRILMVAQRRLDGTTICIITDKPVPGARVVGTMKASICSLEVGKSKIRMSLTKKEEKAAKEKREKEKEKEKRKAKGEKDGTTD